MSTSDILRVAVIGGDGTGPEVAEEGVKVLKAVAALEGIKHELEDNPALELVQDKKEKELDQSPEETQPEQDAADTDVDYYQEYSDHINRRSRLSREDQDKQYLLETTHQREQTLREYLFDQLWELGLNEEELTASRLARSTDARIRKGLEFARAVAEHRSDDNGSGVSALRSAGYTDDEIIEIVAHVALSMFLIYLAEVANPALGFPRIEPMTDS